MGVFAESERVMIAERSKATHNRRRKLGSFLGGKNTRFGVTLADDGKAYVENEEEQVILQRIFNEYNRRLQFLILINCIAELFFVV
jgi:DNA invertase Pin-like site-specific DNA recombinase